MLTLFFAGALAVASVYFIRKGLVPGKRNNEEEEHTDA